MKALLFVAAMLALAVPVLAETKISNPQYKHWAKFKPGTKNISTGELSGGPQRMTMETITTLKEVKPGELTLEITTTMTIGDQKQQPRSKIEVVNADYVPEGTDIKVEKTGTETIEAMGKKIACDIYRLHVPQVDGQADMKLWMSQDIPGAVKSEVHIKHPQMDVTRSMMVQSVEIK